MYDHQDVLHELNDKKSLPEKLSAIRRVVREKLVFVDRVAIALYDEKTDTLKTFAQSSEQSSPLLHYEYKLGDSRSLTEIVEKRRPRVVQRLDIFNGSDAKHTKQISSAGYQASYTMPLFDGDKLIGMLFFNSQQADVFDEQNLPLLDVFGHLILLTILNELAAVRTLVATVQAARQVTHHRDVETGAHTERTAHYARMIAQMLASKYGFDDEYVEKVFLFAPLHDIGKIGVPDSILHKPGKLDVAEFEVMKTHALKGREIVDSFLEDFQLGNFSHNALLRHMVEFHHENMDGSGYPLGLSGQDIPIEARIMAVADIFDALTTERPYKQAWTNQDAIALLKQLSGSKLDPDCVNALISNLERVTDIQQRFKD